MIKETMGGPYARLTIYALIGWATFDN